MKVSFSYLDRQFADVDAYLGDIRKLVLSGKFTLGTAVSQFEGEFAALCGMPHAIGVGSGTDALILSLEMLGVGPGDEVITAANTFIATVGAIAVARARPVFVDSDESFTINPALIEAAITPRTKAILPVHYTGQPANMPAIAEIAKRHNLQIVEDACQSISARYDDKPVGSWGATAGFSLHPLKNLNVWGDGGVIVTRDGELAEKLRLYRNHGLSNRDEVLIFGHNSRLDALHAVIGSRLIRETETITSRRIANARKLDKALGALTPEVRVPRRAANEKHVYHLYIVRVDRRDELLAYLKKNGIDARVHYPVPVHLQPAAKALGYKVGDFPVAERDSRESITLPVHQHLTGEELDYMVARIRSFYRS